jgi:hypothetical protein
LGSVVAKEMCQIAGGDMELAGVTLFSLAYFIIAPCNLIRMTSKRHIKCVSSRAGWSGGEMCWAMLAEATVAAHTLTHS